jgi:CRISPR-associated endonuclease/helicase Cas3
MMQDEQSTFNLFLFWAKLSKDELKSHTFHPLLCHMVDVAVVARAMWRSVLSEAARRKIADAVGLPLNSAEVCITFLAALHDLGKASPAFQLRKESKHLHHLYEELGNPPKCEAHEAPHGRVTAKELPDILIKLFDVSKPVANRFSTIIGGHHGIFPTSLDLTTRCPVEGVGIGQWKQVREKLVQRFTDLFKVSPAILPSRDDNAALMAIAGLVSVADWIGSNDQFFDYAVEDFNALPSLSLSEYANKAEEKAMNALERLGWLGWSQSSEKKTFKDLFDLNTRRPLQDEVIELADTLKDPSIVIIEAPMGEGKTEAALYLADSWGIAPGPRGFYIALPTQATSNQMFGRVKKYLANRYPDDLVNYQLLHGHSSLSAEFRTLKDRGAFVLQGVYADGECAAHAMSVMAAEWFTHRKRGLLAPFGVGTIDQALMAVLQTKHVFVRLFGLAHKTVIIDEVHAYDAYMSKLLERLLEWLAALGSPVVLLSATLPNERRQALLAAYRRGLNQSAVQPSVAEVFKKVSYPRICWATASEMSEQQIEVSELNTRTLRIEHINGRLPESANERFELGERLQEALREGGCAAVICNTVNRAQQVYLALKPYFDEEELDLFHARFLFKDRDEREKNALQKFGKEGEDIEFDKDDKRKVKRPYRSVLVATQVVEQSLDLDFDLMVSDLAPVDLILQRSGRLHRHKRERPALLIEPVMWISDPEEVIDGIPKFDYGTATVYDAHILLRSWLTLKERNQINIPQDIEGLIESVYVNRDCPNVASEEMREHWSTTSKELKLMLREMQSKAVNVIVPEPQYEDDIFDLWNKRLEEDEPEIHASLQALTRLAEPSVSLVCLYHHQIQEIDLKQSLDLKVVPFLLRHSVTLSNRAVVWKLLRQQAPSVWQTSALLRHHRLIELDEKGYWRDNEHEIKLDGEICIKISKL